MTKIKEGYKETEIGVIPEDWDVKNLGEIVDFYNGKAHENDVKEFGEYKIVNSKFISTEGYVVKYTDSCKFPLLKDDITIVMSDIPNGRAIAKTFLINEDNKYTLNQRIGCFRNIKGNTEFLNYLINRNKYYLKFDDGSKQTNLRKNEVLGLILQYPPLPEQQRIAEILSTTDAHIEKLDQIIEDYQLLKKGMMKKLLTEGISHTEFKETEIGSIPKEWNLAVLNNLGDTFNGLSGVTKDDFGSGVPFIPYMNIFSNTKIDTNRMDYVNLSNKKQQNKVKYGDIFFTISSETVEEAGMSSVLLDEVDNMYLNSFCFGYRLYDFDRLIPEFARHLLRSDYVRKSIQKLAQGSTRYNLSKTKVLKIKVALPSLKEQQKISEQLTNLESRLTLLKNEKDDYIQLKKSLMEQLLTGKMRTI